MIGALLEALVLFSLLLCASICDIRTRQIPDYIPLAIVLVGLIRFSPLLSITGFLCAGLPYFFAALFSGGKIGGGDIKLMAACGCVLGPFYGTLQSILGLTLVLLFAAGIGIHSGFHVAKHTSLPLAPFLSAGGSLAYVLFRIADSFQL
ncbi:prepilin peptidase [Paenibacillus camerounensis]|uniref:prepilin peptidase n=1 Tax=Paenibacillus camerounensis TaxID=1243663 RepID=UPI0005A834F1|nr:prepilin peptidase [Paenibacillus camerounensis]